MSADLDTLKREYKLTRDQAMTLAGAAGLPVDVRKTIFERVAKDRGVGELCCLFAQFMGLANSVVENNRQALELFGLCHLGMGTWEAEKLNLPTIFGACNGALIADGVAQDGLCHGCAFRLGSAANQSPSTTCDADFCADLGERPFMCHEDMDGETPTKGCVGFARLRAARKRKEADERLHVQLSELDEIASGAWGDGPKARGAARDRAKELRKAKGVGA